MIAEALSGFLPYPPLLSRSPPNATYPGDSFKHACRFTIQGVVDIASEINHKKNRHLLQCILHSKRCSDVFSIIQPYLMKEEHEIIPQQSYMRLICKLIRNDEISNVNLALDVAKKCDDYIKTGNVSYARLWYLSYMEFILKNFKEPSMMSDIIYATEMYWL